MAKYRLSNQAWYHVNELIPAHSVVEIPDDLLPSRTWTPLDDAARAAQAKLPVRADFPLLHTPPPVGPAPAPAKTSPIKVLSTPETATPEVVMTITQASPPPPATVSVPKEKESKRPSDKSVF